MKIIEKDMDWLLTRVPDFMNFYNENVHLFLNGYLAGGFMRKIVNLGSVEKALKAMYENGTGDIDFFFDTKADCITAVQADFKKLNIKDIPLSPNSAAGYAYETQHRSPINKYASVKYQFIYKNCGPVHEVLQKFDITNCKIATDGKKVYIVEDWEEIEKNFIVRIDNFGGQYLLARLKKYLSGEYRLYEPNKKELLERLLEFSREKPESVRSLIYYYPTLVAAEDVTIFYGMLGDIAHDEKDGVYVGGSLSAKEDFALHMYKRAVEKEAFI